jgi:hypothetical protein
MKKSLILTGIVLLLFTGSYSQSINYLRNKLGDALIDKAVDEKVGKSGDQGDNNSSTTENNSDRPGQKSGSAGLDASLDDVPDALAQASTDYNAKAYKNAKTSLQKAMRTLETKMGQQLLASLPETVKNLSVQKDADQLTTQGTSWAGMTVKREYRKDDTWSAITIYNGSMANLTNQAIYSGMYSSSSENDQNQKPITINGKEGHITFSESSGYSIGISAGQQTFVVIEGVNVASEAEMRAIAESFDYNKILKILGDQ